MEQLYGGIEAGGTKFACAIGNAAGEILVHEEFPTGSPSQTIAKVGEFFYKSGKRLSAIGVGSFGPIDLNPDSATYGRIINSPKTDWQNVDIRGDIARALDTEVKLSTDVGCAAIGEFTFGAGRGSNNLLYLTVGTGIGGTQLLNGHLPQVTTHAELGHIFIPHDLDLDPFPGICPYHSDCFEGLASGLAMEKRAGQRADDVIDPLRWDLEVRYLALGLVNLVYTIRPNRIVMGGGVAKHGGLIEEVSLMSRELINNYIGFPEIVPASDFNAIRGAIRLAAGA